MCGMGCVLLVVVAVTEPTPIKADIEPKFDIEREMIDYFMKELRQFRLVAGVPPDCVAVVLLGSNDETLHSRCNSWSIDENATRLGTCSMAAALFLKRATKEEDEE